MSVSLELYRIVVEESFKSFEQDEVLPVIPMASYSLLWVECLGGATTIVTDDYHCPA